MLTTCVVSGIFFPEPKLRKCADNPEGFVSETIKNENKQMLNHKNVN